KEIYKFSKKPVITITAISLLIISVIICSAFGFYALGVNFGKTVITLNETETHQVFQGFGASSAWVYQSFGLSENSQLKDDTMEALYGDSGLGLNTFRYNVGAGGVEVDSYADPLRGAESFFVAENFTGDYSVFADEGNYDFTRDKGVRALFDKALSLGNIKEVVFFANSPHYLMTKNGKTHGEEKMQNNLKEECYTAFSQYMLVIVNYLYKNYICKYNPNIKIKISPVNEPQWDWGGSDASQEGCHYDPKQLAKFYNTFYSELAQYNEKHSTDFSMDIFESGNYKFNERKTKFKTYIKEFSKYDWFNELDCISLHSYGTDIDNLPRIIFSNYSKNKLTGIEVGVSEYCVMKSGISEGIDMGIYSAKVVLRDLKMIDAVSWNYWLSLSHESYNYEDGLLYWDGADKVWATRRYYTIGQFSKYITQGSVRITADYNDSFGINGVECVAFKRLDGSIVLIVINDSNRDKQIRIKGGYENIQEIVTTQNLSWETQEYKYGGYITSKAKSVTTYIMTNPTIEE
ncbi:MAG: hypothetical protein K2L52_05970, partial [Clostridia bacterium]|nr:hypothetical protein [Clostridia bacterium]